MTRKLKAPDPEKEAMELLKEAAFHPSLDEVWARHPCRFAPEDLPKLIAALRQERALWAMNTERRSRKAKEREQAEATSGAAPGAQPEANGDDWDA